MFVWVTQLVKSTYNAGDQGLIPELERSPLERKKATTPVFCPGSQSQTQLKGDFHSFTHSNRS